MNLLFDDDQSPEAKEQRSWESILRRSEKILERNAEKERRRNSNRDNPKRRSSGNGSAEDIARLAREIKQASKEQRKKKRAETWRGLRKKR